MLFNITTYFVKFYYYAIVCIYIIYNYKRKLSYVKSTNSIHVSVVSVSFPKVLCYRKCEQPFVGLLLLSHLLVGSQKLNNLNTYGG